MKLYNFRFTALPVTLHLKSNRRFLWTRIHGIQIGDWFFGCIKGRADHAAPKQEGE